MADKLPSKLVINTKYIQVNMKGITMLEKARNFKIDDVIMNWARLDTPVNPFGTEQYELQLEVSKEQAEMLKANYFNVKEKEGKMIVSLKRKAKKADGSDNGKVRVVNPDLTPFENVRTIGNGSKGSVIVFQYPYSAAGRQGVANSLTAVQVKELVKYESTGSVDFDAVEAPAETAKPETLF